MARRIAAVLVTIGCLQAGAVSALGLGELTLDSFLNEPFKARVDLLNTEGLNEHQIRIQLATSEDFARLGVDRAYFLTSITFEVEVDDNGRGRILLTSEAPVLEPYLDFIVEARWPSGRLLREYTLLVDPPVFDSAQTVTISASQRVAEIEGDGGTVCVGGTGTDKKKSRAQASSGTQVKVAKSGLAQGEMPERDFGSAASSSPQAGNRYMIRRDETLWAIALEGKPEGATVHQAMLDIQRMNPAAFIDGNINRIKAGYIIYLPDSGDISSGDVSSAMQEVRQQNQDWRDGISSTPGSYSGASLRISTEPEEDLPGAETGDGEAGHTSGSASDTANLENLERSERDRAEVESRLGAMAEQVDTLERIVGVKDEQIAALQKALAEANAANGEATTGSLVDAEAVAEGEATVEPMPAVLEPDVETVVEPEPEVAPAPVVEAAPEVVQQATPAASPQEKGGLFSNMTYIIGLLVAAALAVFFFMRRRGYDEEKETPVSASNDVFADIKLEEENLELDAHRAYEEPVEAPAEKAEAAPARSKGYGEHKHDEYADDMDAGDALAEADIYIAYGRFPQAVDLLRTAIENEPGNAAYKLKLMEVSTELGDQAEVMRQYAELKNTGDADILARAEDVIKNLEETPEVQAPLGDIEEDVVPESFDLSGELDSPGSSEELNLEDDFGSLEIEEFESDDEELDLSADFGSDNAVSSATAEEEDLVFAEDSDAMSTKLDLARAYLDMGDQDGARQIFEEVIAEGSEEQKEEARALIERLD